MQKKISYLIILLTVFTLGFLTGGFMNHSKNNLLSEKSDGKLLYAIVNDKKYFQSDITKIIENDILQLERNIYNLKKNAVIQLIKNDFIDQKNLTVTKSIDGIKTSDPQFQRFTGLSENQLKLMPEKKLNSFIENYKIQKQIEYKQQLQIEKLSALNIKWLIPLNFTKQIKPLFESNSKLLFGTDSGVNKVSILGSYHCPTCPESMKKVNQLMTKFSDKVQFEFRFLLNEPPESIAFQSAVAADCASRQAKFYNIHLQFTESVPQNISEIFDSALKANLDMKNFRKCFESKESIKPVTNDINELKKHVPDFESYLVVNGKMLSSQEPIEILQSMIDQSIQ